MRSIAQRRFAPVRAVHRGFMLAFVASLTALPAEAQLTWGTSGAGGSGTWDANTTSNWFNGTSNVVWPTSGTAGVFAGTAGTVTVSGSVTAQALTFATNGYRITGGTLGLSGTNITTNTGISGTIGSLVSGTFGLTKAGTGTLWLTGSNNYSGGTRVNEGIIGFTNTGAFGTGTVTFGANGTIRSGVSGTLANNFLVPSNFSTGTFDTNGFNNTISGTINALGSRAFVKAGSGTLTLSSSNPMSSNSNPSRIDAGGVVLQNGGGLGTALVTLADGAFVRMATSGTVTSRMALQNGATGTFDSSNQVTTIGATNWGSNTPGTKLVLVADSGTIRYQPGGGFILSNGTDVTFELRSGYLQLPSTAGGQRFEISGNPFVSFNTTNSTQRLFVAANSSGTLSSTGTRASPGGMTFSSVTGGTATLDLMAGEYKFANGSAFKDAVLRVVQPAAVSVGSFFANGLGSGTLAFTAVGTSTLGPSESSGSAPITLAEGATVAMGTVDWSGPISGAGALVVKNQVYLRGSNSFSGGMSIGPDASGGPSLSVFNINALGTGTVSLLAGMLEFSSVSGTVANAWSIDNSVILNVFSGSVTLAGNITSNNALTLNGSSGLLVALQPGPEIQFAAKEQDSGAVIRE